MVNRERGQLLIVSALVIAVMLLTLVLVLNGTLYVENVDGGSRGAAAATDASTVRASVGQDLDRLTTFTADGEGYADTARLSDETDAFSGNYSRFAAGGSPASVSVSLNESASVDVTRIRDGGSGSRPPNDDHMLVTESEARDHSVRVVDFDLNFTVGDQLDFYGSDEFVLHVTDAATPDGDRSAEWTLSIDRAPSSSDVVFATSGPSTCGQEPLSDGDRVHIDIDDGIVEHADGTPICTFEFGAGVSAPYGITIEDRGRIGVGDEHGTYDLVLNEYVPGIETRLSGPFPDVFNATRTAAYDLHYETPGLDYGTRISAPVPRHRVPLLIEDFEDGWDGAWEHDGAGDAGVRSDDPAVRGTVAHSGSNATYIENTSSSPTKDNLLQYDRQLDTSRYDAVTVSFWTQQGDTADGGVEDLDERLVAEYWDGSSWQPIGEVSPASAITTDVHAFRLTDDAARHPGFKIRFRQPESTATDPWYIDDVVVYGVNES